jgi:Ras-related GTP-binding protein A/B
VAILTEESSGNKKFLMTGLDNSGKTSIILSMKGERNLLTYYSLSPTQRIAIEKIMTGNTTFLLWEAGGQKKYRDQFLENFNQYGQNVEKILFVVDVQDKNRYEESIKYFSDIIDHFKLINHTPKVVCFLHKFDPALEGNPEYSDEKLRNLIIGKLAKIVPPEFGFECFKSTIYTIFRKTQIAI